jgi:hypothetical protein
MVGRGREEVIDLSEHYDSMAIRQFGARVNKTEDLQIGLEEHLLAGDNEMALAYAAALQVTASEIARALAQMVVDE